jgi:hypothetical protein
MTKPEQDTNCDPAPVDVFPWGLYIDEQVDDKLAEAAFKRFGENYLGSCH